MKDKGPEAAEDFIAQLDAIADERGDRKLSPRSREIVKTAFIAGWVRGIKAEMVDRNDDYLEGYSDALDP